LNCTVPNAVGGERVAVSVTLTPKGAVVTLVLSAEVSAAVSTVAVLACTTVTLFAVEVLALSSADVVGVKAAVKELAPSGSSAVSRDAVPALTVTGFPRLVLPVRNCTVPASAGETVATSLKLTP
jgi:hypothetical protein